MNTSIAAFTRVQEFANDFVIDQGNLYCQFCAKYIDFSKLSVVQQHLESKKHIHLKLSSKSQKSLTQLNYFEIKQQIVEDFILMLIKADIAFEKVDKMKQFLGDYCKLSSHIPSAKSIRDYHFLSFWREKEKIILGQAKNQIISILFDSTKDIQGKTVLNTILSTFNKQQQFLCDTRFIIHENNEVITEIYTESWQRVDCIIADKKKYKINKKYLFKIQSKDCPHEKYCSFFTSYIQRNNQQPIF